jgi:NADPH:quinone reductase-like Zn-dependent oxidoreductase
MKAAVYTEYGPPEVLRIEEVAPPRPLEREILVRIRATSVNFGDLLARRFAEVKVRDFAMPAILWLPARLVFGWTRPRIRTLGNEFAGVVESIGPGVQRFAPGDEVFGYRAAAMGTYAEYVCMPETGCVAAKPANLSFEAAAVVPYGAVTALALLRKACIRPGDDVLIIGASGGIGSAAIQLARHQGARVTAVCGTRRLDYARALGADAVVDYTREDPAANGESYDVIFDVPGKGTLDRCMRALRPGGVYLLASFKAKHLLRMAGTSRGGKRVVCAMSTDSAADLESVRQLVEAGALKAIVDRSFPLERIAEAHRYAQRGERTGSIAITVA